MSFLTLHHLTTRSGVACATPHSFALANLVRHTRRDAILIASAKPGSLTRGDAVAGHLTREDIDGLSRVVCDLGGHHLDLVLHGTMAGLDAASELVSLLRGRYDSIRALVPNAALSVMSLIASACDTTVLPNSALLGIADDPHEPSIGSREAANWVARNCSRPNLSQQIELATIMFAEEESPRAPITAAHALDLGLQIHVVCERSGIGADLQTLGESLEEPFCSRTVVKLIENHKGTYYVVEN